MARLRRKLTIRSECKMSSLFQHNAHTYTNGAKLDLDACFFLSKAAFYLLTILITIKLIFQYSTLIAFWLSPNLYHGFSVISYQLPIMDTRNLCKVLPTSSSRDEMELSTFKSTLDIGFQKIHQVRQSDTDLDNLSSFDIVVS